MKKILFFLFLSCFFLSACSSGGSFSLLGGGGSSLPEEIRSGDGLDASFSLSQGIERNFLEYELDLRNSGKLPIIIEDVDEEISLTTDPRDGSGRSYFTDESTFELYDKVFALTSEGLRNSDDSFTIKGVLVLKDEVLQNPNNKVFKYLLTLSYDYRTEFSNNVLVDMKKREVNIDGSFSQAAPVKVSSVKLRPLPDEEFLLDFEVQNGGRGEEVVLDTTEFRLGTNILNCDPFTLDSNGKRIPLTSEPKLDEKTRTIVYSCFVDLTDFDSNALTQTTVGGFLEYKYSIQMEGSSNILPKGTSN